MGAHIHTWRTRYITVGHFDIPSGMECLYCQAILQQFEVEDILNRPEVKIDFDKGEFIYHHSTEEKGPTVAIVDTTYVGGKVTIK